MANTVYLSSVWAPHDVPIYVEHLLVVLDTNILATKGRRQGNLSVRGEKRRRQSELRTTA